MRSSIRWNRAEATYSRSPGPIATLSSGGWNMNTNRTFRILLAVLGFATVLGTAAITGGQVTQQVKKKEVVTVAYYPKLEVKRFSGDFTQWGLTDGIEKGGSLTKEFRWSTNRSDVAAARYEIR